MSSHGTDPAETRKFERLATAWWDGKGAFAPLHAMNPVRVAYIRDQACAAFGRAAGVARPLSGLRVLDIGCGGGILAEPLARLGGEVTGIDPVAANIEAAQAHAQDQELDIAYEAATVQEVLVRGSRFDLAVASEVIEHVPDVPAFLAAIAGVVRPGGLLVVTTLSRTVRSFAQAIVGAEYALGWLPRGTHDWRRFLTPAELARHLRHAGLRPLDVTGIEYRADRAEFRAGRGTSVNYMMSARR